MTTHNLNPQNENLTFITLKDLFLSKHNVRTVPATKQEDKLLRASIKAQGITQNLIVVADGQQYGVIAGGRRLTQLQALLEEGVIKESYLVPCLIEDENNISALSLAENIKASMHPADEFMAFQSMMNEGKSIADISNEFGIAQKQVKQRLKMAGVSPKLVQHYRKGKIDLDAIMAFTVSEDHKKQEACYNDLSKHYMRPWHIKKYLLDEAVSTDDALVKLVTLKAFKKAGGTVTTDLFESVSYINERELLEQLATDILNKKAQSLAKEWKWVEVSLSQHNKPDYKGRLQADYVGVPEKLTTDLQDKHKALDALYDKDGDEWTEDDTVLEDKLNTAIEKLEAKQEAYRAFTDAQKSVSGAVVSFNYDGEITISYGYVKKEDMAQAFPKDETLALNGTDQSTSIESAALKRDLDSFKLQALQSEVMKNDALAYDLMVYTLAKSVLGRNDYSAKVLEVEIKSADLNATNGIDDTSAAQTIEGFKAGLELAWLSQPSEPEKFAAFRALSGIQKKKLLSFCTAQSMRLNTALEPSITEAIDFDMAQHWTPTQENYFKRIKAADILAIGKEKIGEEWASMNAKLPKAKLIDQLCVHTDMQDWMPESMAS
jgi:ParB family chromosome partitioning protein